MDNALDFGSSSLDFSPGWGNCVLYLGYTTFSTAQPDRMLALISIPSRRNMSCASHFMQQNQTEVLRSLNQLSLKGFRAKCSVYFWNSDFIPQFKLALSSLIMTQLAFCLLLHGSMPGFIWQACDNDLQKI